jgi:hypothetical protein
VKALEPLGFGGGGVMVSQALPENYQTKILDGKKSLFIKRLECRIIFN